MKKIDSVEIIKHKTCNCIENPFFTHHKYLLKNHYKSGEISKEYSMEYFDRLGIDCVAVIPYKVEFKKINIGILSAFRPPVYMRKNYKLYEREKSYTNIYECVAGSLEPSDYNNLGLEKRAKEELLEEAGFDVDLSEIKRLGKGFFPSHGQSTEKIHMFYVNITGLQQKIPKGDGSVNEELNKLHFFEINEIKEMCFKGIIEDPKIEIGVYRLENELR